MAALEQQLRRLLLIGEAEAGDQRRQQAGGAAGKEHDKQVVRCKAADERPELRGGPLTGPIGNRMTGFHNLDLPGGDRVAVFHHHQAGVQTIAQNSFQSLSHPCGRLAGPDRKDTGIVPEVVGPSTDPECLSFPSHMAADRFDWVHRRERSRAHPSKERTDSRLRHTDAHEAGPYGVLSCLKQRLGQVCRGTLI